MSADSHDAVESLARNMRLADSEASDVTLTIGVVQSRIRLVFEPVVFAEVELDWRENAVFVLVGALSDGQVPDGYYVSSEGKRARWHLSEILESCERRDSASELRQAVSAANPQEMNDQVEAFAEVMRTITRAELHRWVQVVRDSAEG
jgi:hypothetical protein